MKSFHREQPPMTTDKWAERFAKQLREDFKCHIENTNPEDTDRYLIISLRQWMEPYQDIIGSLINNYGNYRGLAALERIVKRAKEIEGFK